MTQLLIDTIPLLCRSKRDVIIFCGDGIEEVFLLDILKIVNVARDSITKFEIVRKVIERVNGAGERTLRERREILKRVSEFENFSTCCPNDMLKAKGLVSEIREVINIKDSFTRMRQEVEKERREKLRNILKK